MNKLVMGLASLTLGLAIAGCTENQRRYPMPRHMPPMMQREYAPRDIRPMLPQQYGPRDTRPVPPQQYGPRDMRPVPPKAMPPQKGPMRRGMSGEVYETPEQLTSVYTESIEG